MDTADLPAFLYLYHPASHPWNGNTHSWGDVPPQLVNRDTCPSPQQAYRPCVAGVSNFCTLTIRTVTYGLLFIQVKIKIFSSLNLMFVHLIMFT